MTELSELAKGFIDYMKQTPERKQLLTDQLAKAKSYLDGATEEPPVVVEPPVVERELVTGVLNQYITADMIDLHPDSKITKENVLAMLADGETPLPKADYRGGFFGILFRREQAVTLETIEYHDLYNSLPEADYIESQILEYDEVGYLDGPVFTGKQYNKWTGSEVDINAEFVENIEFIKDAHVLVVPNRIRITGSMMVAKGGEPDAPTSPTEPTPGTPETPTEPEPPKQPEQPSEPPISLPDEKDGYVVGRIIPEVRNCYHLAKAQGRIDEFYDGVLDAAEKTRWQHEFGLGRIVSVIGSWTAEEEVEITEINFYDGPNGLPDDKAVNYYIQYHGSDALILVASFTGRAYGKWQKNQVTSLGFVDRIYQSKVKNEAIVPLQIDLQGRMKEPKEFVFTKKPSTFDEIVNIGTYASDIFDKTGEPRLERVELITNTYGGTRMFLDIAAFVRGPEDDPTYKFTPAHNAWFYDPTLEALKAAGNMVVICPKDIPSDMKATYPEGFQHHSNSPMFYKPEYTTILADGSEKHFNDEYYFDKQQEGTYEYMKMAYGQIAARWGRNKNVPMEYFERMDLRGRMYGTTYRDNDPLKNEIKIGMGVVDVIEVHNEYNKSWDGEKGFMSPQQYASFYIAVAKEIKRIDPTMKVIPGGIVGPRADYYKAMADIFRDHGVDPKEYVDGLTYHMYHNNKLGEQRGTDNEKTGVPPELATVDELALDFARVSQEHFGGVPIYLTETGHDTRPYSQQLANPILNAAGEVVYNSVEAQGIYALRIALWAAETRHDFVSFYEMFDQDNSGLEAGLYWTTGHYEHSKKELIDGNWIEYPPVPRPAANLIFQAVQLLSGFWLKEVETRGKLKHHVYTDGMTDMDVYWVASDADDAEAVSISIPNGATVHSLSLETQEAYAIHLSPDETPFEFAATVLPVIIERL